jgi:hypothetical protein
VKTRRITSHFQARRVPFENVTKLDEPRH